MRLRGTPPIESVNIIRKIKKKKTIEAGTERPKTFHHGYHGSLLPKNWWKWSGYRGKKKWSEESREEKSLTAEGGELKVRER